LDTKAALIALMGMKIVKYVLLDVWGDMNHLSGPGRVSQDVHRLSKALQCHSVVPFPAILGYESGSLTKAVLCNSICSETAICHG
jgi:hypothetical protein